MGLGAGLQNRLRLTFTFFSFQIAREPGTVQGSPIGREMRFSSGWIGLQRFRIARSIFQISKGSFISLGSFFLHFVLDISGRAVWAVIFFFSSSSTLQHQPPSSLLNTKSYYRLISPLEIRLSGRRDLYWYLAVSGGQRAGRRNNPLFVVLCTYSCFDLEWRTGRTSGEVKAESRKTKKIGSKSML